MMVKDSQISRRKKCKPSKKDDLWLLIEKKQNGKQQAWK